ncbi:hypothetical protein CPB86DRAFT_175550 [Serendipita vermifera]|nr:hypothetical protein CPB86DRAFT_175550 [Serendipita vermifera]
MEEDLFLCYLHRCSTCQDRFGETFISAFYNNPSLPSFHPAPRIDPPTGQNSVSQHRNLRNGQSPARGFPNSNESFIRQLPPPLQQPMRDILSSTWWINNTMEPNHELRQFIRVESRTRFHCLLCKKIFVREDRAIAHVRSDIDHRPFTCNRLCGDNTCTLAFLSNRDLLSHKIKPTTTCPHCSIQVTSRNLTRHMRSQRCLRSNPAQTTTRGVRR